MSNRPCSQHLFPLCIFLMLCTGCTTPVTKLLTTAPIIATVADPKLTCDELLQRVETPLTTAIIRMWPECGSLAAQAQASAQSTEQILGKTIFVEPTDEFATIETQASLDASAALLNGDPAIIDDIRAAPEAYAPPVLYLLSSVLFAAGEKDEAMFWFYAGQLRARSDANKALDPSAPQAVIILNQQFGPPINRYAFTDLEKLEETVRAVLAWDERTLRVYDPRWIALHGAEAFRGGKVSFAPQAEWATIDATTREQYWKGFLTVLQSLPNNGTNEESNAPDETDTDQPADHPTVESEPAGSTNAEAITHFNRGIAYAAERRWDEAVTEFSRAIELDSAYATAYYNRGLAYHGQGKLTAAIADYQRVIQLAPEFAEVHYHLGFAYHTQNKLQEAIAAYTGAVELDPANASAYNNRGKAYETQGRWDEALADYNRALDLDPTDVIAYNNRGSIYLAQGKLNAAVADYTQAIELNPNYNNAYYDQALAAYAQGKMAEATAHHIRAIQLQPTFAEAYYNRGRVHAAQHNQTAALADFDRAIQINAAYPDAYISRGTLYHEQGDLASALADYTRAIKLEPDDAAAYNNRGNAYRELEQYEEAIADYEQAFAIDADYLYTFNQACWFGSLSGNAAIVLNTCEKAVRLASDANRPLYRDSRGLARVLTGDIEGAIADFQAFLAGTDPEKLGDIYTRRQGWVVQLETGEDPDTIFDKEMLETLRNE